MACCSCLTSFAWGSEGIIGQSQVPLSENDNLFDSKLLIGLDLNFSSLLKCFLLDKRDLIVRRKEGMRLAEKFKPTRIKRTILFISVMTSSSFIGREAMVALLCWVFWAR